MATLSEITIPSSIGEIIHFPRGESGADSTSAASGPNGSAQTNDKGSDTHTVLLRSFAFVKDEPPAPQAMLIEDVIPLEGLTFIGGQSSAGKTFVAILLAACAATGKPFFGREVKERVGSVIVAAEGRSMLRSRILAALKELDIADDENMPIAWLKEIPDFSN
jgi:AAA domain-containing protein